MILYKKIEPREVLEMLIAFVGQSLPQEILESKAQVTATFCEDNAVEMYIVDEDTSVKESKLS